MPAMPHPVTIIDRFLMLLRDCQSDQGRNVLYRAFQWQYSEWYEMRLPGESTYMYDPEMDSPFTTNYPVI